MSVNKETELKSLKERIKKWEREFSELNSKKPSKEDIHDAPTDVKDAYRNYWKLKNKTDSPQDDVWGENLNKSYKMSETRKVKTSNVKKFCEKIKQRSSLKAKDHPVLKNSRLLDSTKPASVSENDNKNICKHSAVTDDDGAHLQDSLPCNTDGNMTSDIISAIELPLKGTPAKFVKSFETFKRIKSVNMLSSSLDLDNSVKTVHFKQHLNEDWLKRCDESILKDLKSNFDENLPKTSGKDINNIPSHYLADGFITMSQQSYDGAQTKDVSGDNLKHTSLKFVEAECSIDTEANIIKSSKIHQPNDYGEGLEDMPIPVNLHIKSTVLDDSIKVSHSQDDKLLDLNQQSVETNENCDMEMEPKTKKRKLSSIAHVPDSKTARKVSNLKRKIAAGTLNENFLKLNIKKKKFSRGHRPVNVRRLKWNKWKQLKKGSDGNSSNVTGCFKCGEFGHWARQCNSSIPKKETENFSEEENFMDIPLPTLEEAAKLAQEAKPRGFKVEPFTKCRFPCKTPSQYVTQDHSKEEESVTDHGENCNNFLTLDSRDLPKNPVKPLYETSVDGLPIETPKAVFDALKEIGYSNFREGQETAIMRVLCGLSTLVVLPTGSGKSLCYQLPAYLYAKHSKSLAVVVSPLVSLMEDQVTGLPSCLHAVCLHSGMSEIQKKNAMKDITEGSAQILLVSPEAIIGNQLFTNSILNSTMPPISFVCIDEVHCISQWSHNFRPSYLQLYKVLTRKMGVKCILGLTATATQSTIEDIILHLDIKCINESVVGSTNVPPNLQISISKDKDKDKALLQLLNGDRFRKCSSIIIYCIRRVETERLAALLRTCLQDEEAPENEGKGKKRKTKNKKSFAWTIEAYHAGLAPPRRRSIQKQFMSGKLRVVIATVAFGMGLDKSDVRAIIHYNMPKAFESYVQEIGRAGRDGLDSHCHLFLDNEGNDLWEQQKHIYANSMDRHTLRKLLKRVFQRCKCSVSEKSNIDIETNSKGEDNSKCPKHELAFLINETIQELDVKEENISTLLCYLELHLKQWIEILPPTYSTCTIRCYGGPKQMHAIALKNPAIATALALSSENGKKWDKGSSFTFPIIQVASAVGWESSAVKRSLKRLEWNDNKRKTGVIVEFSDLAFHVSAPGNLSDEELDEVLDFLYSKVTKNEETELKNLKLLFSVFQKFSFPHYWDCCDEVNKEYSEGIKQAINKYFTRNDLLYEEFKDNVCLVAENNNEVDPSYVKSLIRDVICTHQDQTFSGRSIARIFHGIGSPCFPAEVWGTIRKFWRCLLPVNFNSILKLANEELRNFK